ncbi:DUF1579 family protein [Paenibacillus nasutitermitis]|uniref:DUF1579 domain-containing protein n=1 Tax=Paenibacillus nasutitermitis TaxID=1652958 RepID=A0A916YNK9_9BACL|nr:DUF1579 family protein [Paenibacillus nasutitermitis]GGD53268.1 hypothetical protein GCM10010911_08530 [Paenibacillus nasutitermitis]
MSTKRDPAMERLNVFVGKWNTEGVIKASPSGAAEQLKAVDTYEWLPGGYFLIHHIDGHMGKEEVKAIEIIGYDPSSQKYTTHSYDNQGNFNAYKANLLDRDWTILGESERFTGMLSEDGNILTGTWELSHDGENWAQWMDIKLTKVI